MKRTPEDGNFRYLGGQLTPFGQGGGSVLFKFVTTVEMAFDVEVVVGRGMNGGEFLKCFTSRNFAIAPSHRLNGWCEFSARLLNQRPHDWEAALPIAFIAARYERSRSVTIE